MLKDMADAMTSLGEPSLVSLGLGGYSPTGLIQQTLELIHVGGNVSWCASIAILTVIIRLVCLPLIVKAQANTAKLNNIKPQIEEVQAQLRELANSYDAAAKATASLRLKQLYQEHGCHPVKVFDVITMLLTWHVLIVENFFLKTLPFSRHNIIHMQYSLPCCRPLQKCSGVPIRLCKQKWCFKGYCCFQSLINLKPTNNSHTFKRQCRNKRSRFANSR